MKVITFTSSDFEHICAQLYSDVKKSGFVPDVILGIATGGVYVVDNFSMDKEKVCSIKLQRPSTQAKNENLWFGATLKKMPYFVCDLLRVCEAYTRQAKFFCFGMKNKKSTLPNIDWIGQYNRILIVDDAIDTGATMALIKSKVEKVLGAKGVVKTAVIVKTMNSGIVEPDYAKFRGVLCRFPWASDYKDV